MYCTEFSGLKAAAPSKAREFSCGRSELDCPAIVAYFMRQSLPVCRGASAPMQNDIA
jgi:hypothetical protein